MAEMKRQRSTFIDAFDNATGGIIPEMLDEAFRWDRKQRGPARNLEEMCQRFSPNNSLDPFNYRHLSDSVHPSFRTAEYHVPADVNGQGSGLRETVQRRRTTNSRCAGPLLLPDRSVRPCC